MFLRFKLQDGRKKMAGKRFLGKVASSLCSTLGVKNFVKITLSHTISKINALLHFMQKFKMEAKNGAKTIFREKSPVHSADTLGVKNSVKIILSCTISELKEFLCFTQKFKTANKNGWKRIFGKITSSLWKYLGSQISPKSLYLALFQKLEIAS